MLVIVPVPVALCHQTDPRRLPRSAKFDICRRALGRMLRQGDGGRGRGAWFGGSVYLPHVHSERRCWSL